MQQPTIERSQLDPATIADCLRDAYDVTATQISHLALGNDSAADVYAVTDDSGERTFLKVRQETPTLASLTVPRYLYTSGIEAVVAPRLTVSGDTHVMHGEFAIMLYPFIDGAVGMDAGLTDAQWATFGALVKRIHTCAPPDAIRAVLPRETFVPNPRWSGVIRQLTPAFLERRFANRFQTELASFLRDKQGEIVAILTRCEALGAQLQRRTLPFVLCHADIHTANLLVRDDGRLAVVDWEQPLLAPKERDLMFVPGGREARLFYEGYGATDVNPLALAYYRYEWVVQDIGDYAERAFFMTGLGDDALGKSVDELMAMFAPGDVVEAAYASEQSLPS